MEVGWQTHPQFVIEATLSKGPSVCVPSSAPNHLLSTSRHLRTIPGLRRACGGAMARGGLGGRSPARRCFRWMAGHSRSPQAATPWGNCDPGVLGVSRVSGFFTFMERLMVTTGTWQSLETHS